MHYSLQPIRQFFQMTIDLEVSYNKANDQSINGLTTIGIGTELPTEVQKCKNFLWKPPLFVDFDTRKYNIISELVKAEITINHCSSAKIICEGNMFGN